MSDNMKIWNAVKETDPAHVKTVQQRGGFSAIDAQYTIQRATEQFGAVGAGWGYDVVYDYKHLPNDVVMVVAYVTIWHGKPENKFGPIAGMNPILDGKKRVDDDAAKKALTDAITKGLSHLGFSADVFLGMYDDNKYIQAMRDKHTADKEAEHKDRVNEIIESIKNMNTMEALSDLKFDIKSEVELMPQGVAAKIKQAFAAQVKNLTQDAT
jgi:hypothetical protein